MIPQVFIFAIFTLPLRTLESILSLFGLRLDVHAIAEFAIVLYQYLVIAFATGASVGIFNWILFYLVKNGISWLEQTLRFDTKSLYDWILTTEVDVEEGVKHESEKEQQQEGEEGVPLHILQSIWKQTEAAAAAQQEQQRNTAISETKNEETPPSPPSTPIRPPNLPARPDISTPEILSTPEFTTTTQTSHYEEETNKQRARTPHQPPPPISEDSITAKTTSSSQTASQSADTEATLLEPHRDKKT